MNKIELKKFKVYYGYTGKGAIPYECEAETARMAIVIFRKWAGGCPDGSLKIQYVAEIVNGEEIVDWSWLKRPF